MSLHGTLMESLLTWVNSLKVDEPIERLSQMQDLNIFIKIITKLNGNNDEAARILQQPLEERLKFLQRHCRCGSKAEDLVQWQKVLAGENNELEICKVIVLLFYVWNMKCKNAQEWETFDHKTQTELASILRFVLDNEDDLSLDDKLIHFLQRKARVISTSDSASSSDDTMSPTVPTKKTQVRFLELHRVASSSTMKSLPLDSPSSPMSEVLHMPQFQIRRLRKQLIEGRDLRDELELELSEIKKRLAEKEAQIFLMQQRIERLVVLNERQENQQEPREMDELREKNESLMIRLRDALKQCQDMKTDRIQLERKNDQLSDENGDLSYKVRDLSSRLAQLQDALNETTEEHEASVAGWKQQQSQLEMELNTAITEKKSLEERNQILQEKISMLEEQLKKMEDSESRDKGERLGDVLKLEHLQQEVVASNTKILSLQAQITQMEEEKTAARAELESQKSRFEAEKMQLQDIVTNLQTSLSEITFQKERQDQEARLQEEKLTGQITNLKLEISKLKVSLTQKDQELSGAHKEVEEERRQRGQLEVVLQKQEEASKKNIAELSHQVDHLGGTLRQTEGKLLELNEQLGLNTQQMFSLQQERDKFAKERESAITMFNEYKNTKEEEVNALGKTCQALRNDHQAGLVAVEELKKEKAELSLKVQELDATILDLIAKCQNLDAENDTQSKSHASTLESLRTRLSEQEAQLKVYEQKVSEMELVSEDNGKIREQLLSLEDTVKNLTELLDKEKENSAKLKTERQKSSELEGNVKTLKESRDQAVTELDKEKSAVKNLQSRITQLEEEFRAKTENLQQELGESSAAIQKREEEIKKLTMEMSTWKDRADRASQVEADIEKLRKDHKEVCQQLETEKFKVSQMETEAKATMSTQQDQVQHLEAELSAAKAQLKEKEAQEQKLLHTIQSSEEKLRLAQKEDAEHVSQLEIARSNNEQELQVLTKKLSDEKQKTAELQATLKSLEEVKSEKIFALESQVSSVQGVIQNLEETLQKVSAKLEHKSKQYKESQVKHQQEFAQKEEEVHHLVKEKEKVLSELKTEQAAKLEAEAQLQKCMEVHKNEFSALQNELSRSLDLITMKESELERLTKERSVREEEIQKAKLNAASLTKEVEEMKVYKESATSQEEQLKHYIQTVKATESEVSTLKATLSEKDRQVERLEQDLHRKTREGDSVQQQYQATLGEVQALQSRTAELESRCLGLEDAVRVSGKEAADARAAAFEKASASEQHEKGMQTLATEVQQERRRVSELEKKLEEARALQSESEASLEALKKELIHKVQELEQSQKSLSESSNELSSVKAASQEHEKELSATKVQVAQHQKEMEKKTLEIQSLQKELSKLAAKLTSNEHSYGEVKELLVKETSRSKELEQQLRSVQERLEASSKELDEKQGAVQNMTTEASSYKEEAEKQRMKVEGLEKTLSSHQATTAQLEKEIKVWQEKCSHKEEEMSSVQSQLEELVSLRNLYQEIKAEQSQRASQHEEELLQNQKAIQTLQMELEKTKAEAASVGTLRGDLGQKEKMLENLEKEMNEYRSTADSLQEENKHLAAENATLSQTYDQELKKMQTELVRMSEKNTKELDSLRLQYEKKVSEGKEQIQDITSKYEHAKSKIIDERQKFQEEKQKMLTQVDQLEAAKKEQSEQVRDLNKQINQQEKTIRNQQQKLKQRDSEAHDDLEKTQKKVSELESQLEKEVQAVEHYKAQMEKAKLHYDAKKQQSQELSEELQSVSREQEKLHKENSELKGEAERLNKELQLSLLQTKEAEQNCKNLSSQVRSLEAQVEYADRQLRELGKLQVSTDAMKSRETLCPPRVTRSHADVSIDSLDMSDEEEHPLNSTRKNGRSHREPSTSTAKSGSPEASSNRLPQKVESLESLYFTPIPNRVKSKLDSSIGSIGDLFLDSSKKTRSARRRTTQVINITMTKTNKEEVDPDQESANTSFYSLRSAPSHQSLHQPHHTRRGGKPQPAVSAPALTSLPSMESLGKQEHTSSDDSLNNSVLMSLPGYRPNTRSSARLSQSGGRSSFYLNTCQDEPDPQEDWTRIAELQQRNRACLPHLKTSYPLESRPSVLAATITDEEMKTGDPKETLRRATLLPSQIQESMAGTRRMTMTSAGIEHSMAGGGITTRQQRKRVSEEPHYGADTPESKKSASCFPRPMTPKDKPETRRMSSAVESKANISQQSHTSRRQTMAFSILNTPKKLGSTLLKRGLNKKSTPKNTPQARGGTSKSPHLSIRKSPSRKSPRTSSAKSPKASKFFERNQKKK